MVSVWDVARFALAVALAVGYWYLNKRFEGLPLPSSDANEGRIVGVGASRCRVALFEVVV